jgi:hypothetical protein
VPQIQPAPEEQPDTQGQAPAEEPAPGTTETAPGEQVPGTDEGGQPGTETIIPPLEPLQ